MPPPTVIASPPSQGAAIHPLLLALFSISPSLSQAIIQSNTSPGTLSHAVKGTFTQLKQGKSPATAQAVWDLIGEAKLVPADAAELLTQLCDLFDAELDLAARKFIGIETISEIVGLSDSSLVSKSSPQHAYLLPMTLPGVWTLEEVIKHNFKSEQVDYQFPGQEEPTDAAKVSMLCNTFHEGVIIQLQRYKFDFSLDQVGKVYDRVEFTDKLSGKSLGEYCTPAAKPGVASCTLELNAVVVHDDHAGYSVLLKSADDGKFYKACSHIVDNEEDDPPSVLPDNSFGGLNDFFGGAVGDETAYLLFYTVKGGGGLLANVAQAIRKSMSKSPLPQPAAAPTTLAPASPVDAQPDKPAVVPPATAAGGGGGCCVVQ